MAVNMTALSSVTPKTCLWTDQLAYVASIIAKKEAPWRKGRLLLVNHLRPAFLSSPFSHPKIATFYSSSFCTFYVGTLFLRLA